MTKEFVTYNQSLSLKELGFDEPCFGTWDRPDKLWTGNPVNGILDIPEDIILAPLYQQAINFLYIYSNKQIDIELKGSDTYEERVRKINQGCEDLRNLQNNKSNQ